LPYLSDLRSLPLDWGGLRLQDSNIDEQLSALGQVPSNLSELVSRLVGDRPLTLVDADALLANLTEAGDLPAPAEPVRAAFGGLGTTAAVVAAAPTPLSSPAFTSLPLAASVAPLFDSRPPPPSTAPPVFDTGATPVDVASSAGRASVFDEKPEPEYFETTAQAIVAAFDDADSQASSDLQSPPNLLGALALEMGASSPAEIPPERPLRRAEMRGSRRPDLDELLDQPLDAVDFERTEPVPDDTGTEAHSSDVPTDLPPPGAPGDDFEILVDDEILEIAEDDVELVDDDASN
jgi:hypothetical protein